MTIFAKKYAPHNKESKPQQKNKYNLLLSEHGSADIQTITER